VKRRELIRHLEKNGCALLKEGAKHSRWINLADRTKQSALPRHTEVDDYLARAICHQLGIPPVK
jgi:mRNA interferase HicA